MLSHIADRVFHLETLYDVTLKDGSVHVKKDDGTEETFRSSGVHDGSVTVENGDKRWTFDVRKSDTDPQKFVVDDNYFKSTAPKIAPTRGGSAPRLRPPSSQSRPWSPNYKPPKKQEVSSTTKKHTTPRKQEVASTTTTHTTPRTSPVSYGVPNKGNDGSDSQGSSRASTPGKVVVPGLLHREQDFSSDHGEGEGGDTTRERQEKILERADNVLHRTPAIYVRPQSAHSASSRPSSARPSSAREATKTNQQRATDASGTDTATEGYRDGAAAGGGATGAGAKGGATGAGEKGGANGTPSAAGAAKAAISDDEGDSDGIFTDNDSIDSGSDNVNASGETGAGPATSRGHGADGATDKSGNAASGSTHANDAAHKSDANGGSTHRSDKSDASHKSDANGGARRNAVAATSTARSSSAKPGVTAEEEEFNARGLVPARAGSKPFAFRKTNKNAQPPPAVTYTEGAATAQETEQGADITATDTPPGAGPRNTTDTGRVVPPTNPRLLYSRGIDFPVKPPTPPGKTANNQPPAESEEDESSSQHYSGDFSDISPSSISHRSSGDDIDPDALNAAKPDGYHDLPGKNAARRKRPVTATLIEQPKAAPVETGTRAQSAGAKKPLSILDMPNPFDKSTSSEDDATKERKRERAERAATFAQLTAEKENKKQEERIKEEFGKKSLAEMRKELGYTTAGRLDRKDYEAHYRNRKGNQEEQNWVWKNQVYEEKEADERRKEIAAHEQKIQNFKNLSVNEMYSELGLYQSYTDAQLQEAWERNANNTWWRERYRMLLAKRQQMQLQREQQEKAEKEAALKAEIEKQKAEKERLEAIQTAEREKQAALARSAEQQKENERLREERERAEAESKKIAEEEAERKAAAEKAAKVEAARKRAEEDVAQQARIDAKRNQHIPKNVPPGAQKGGEGKKPVLLTPQNRETVDQAKTMKLGELKIKIGEIRRLLQGAVDGPRKAQLNEVLRELELIQKNYTTNLHTEFTLPPTWLSMRYIPTGPDTTDLE